MGRNEFRRPRRKKIQHPGPFTEEFTRSAAVCFFKFPHLLLYRGIQPCHKRISIHRSSRRKIDDKQYSAPLSARFRCRRERYRWPSGGSRSYCPPTVSPPSSVDLAAISSMRKNSQRPRISSSLSRLFGLNN